MASDASGLSQLKKTPHPRCQYPFVVEPTPDIPKQVFRDNSPFLPQHWPSNHGYWGETVRKIAEMESIIRKLKAKMVLERCDSCGGLLSSFRRLSAGSLLSTGVRAQQLKLGTVPSYKCCDGFHPGDPSRSVFCLL